ncbi:PaaI family thioesterase [Salipiger sp. 1_MG-2023]|uniref:PaaI family thioesterase n=1 Tax=Salipiger sp. 1_MG-2023 TaxID=3062665 RepID=UPI0026E276C2|nr:PaaI family thioesterase [Salipiger sp. 1_MG-2023]MDO6587283.1 PaaI family thioesterase [Salipiger sp. 1_MG-2023]
MNIDQRIRDSFARQGMMETLGARLRSIRAGAVEIEAPIRAEVSQQQGFGHAALAFGIGDSAAGYSALSILPEGMEVLASEMKIHLLAPARGDRLIARGRIIKPGRRLVIAAADVFALSDQGEVQIALLIGTIVPVPA